MKLHESEYGVKQMCQVLGVSRSGYYAWRSRPDSRRAQANQRLLVQIREEYQLSQKDLWQPTHSCGPATERRESAAGSGSPA